MNSEWLLFGLLTTGALTPLLLSRHRLGKWVWSLAAFAVLSLFASAFVFASFRQKGAQASEEWFKNLPHQGRPGGYVTSDKCQACHPSQYASWHRSYHRTMTQYATPEAVVGRFDDVHFGLNGELYHLERRGNEFWVELIDPDWKLAHSSTPGASEQLPSNAPRVWKRASILTGSHHMQTFWVPSRSGNLQFGFPFAFLIDDQRWVPRNDAFLMDPRLPPPFQTWNGNCLQCHSTAGQPRPDATNANLLDTHVGEIGISCEACHGPAAPHVQANRDPRRRYQSHWRTNADATIVNPARQPSKTASQICGQCHSVRWTPRGEFYTQEGSRYRPGDELGQFTSVIRPAKHASEPWLKELLKKDPSLIEDRYWPDGMVRVSGREYNGLIESPCYERGELSCLSCHSMHQSQPDDQLAAGMSSNQACLQCHTSYRDRIREHSHHALGSSGSECYNCHMPHTTYGLLKAIRSHQIDSPSVASSLQTGRPNACNLCHLDQSLSWTAKNLSEWFGQPVPTLSEEQQTISAAALWALRGDAGQRALIAWHMGWPSAKAASGEAWLAPYLGQLLVDPYSAVRYIAQRSLKRLPGYTELKYDYIGPPQDRAAARQRAFDLWRRSPLAAAHANERLLIGANGALRVEKFDALLRQRDDRYMYLQE